jgi:hypothetical protein
LPKIIDLLYEKEIHKGKQQGQKNAIDHELIENLAGDECPVIDKIPVVLHDLSAFREKTPSDILYDSENQHNIE